MTKVQYEAQVRQYLEDNGHRVVEELTLAVVGGGGTRLYFTLSKTNIVLNSAGADINQAGFVTTGFTMDLVNGNIVFAVAPPLSTTVPTSLFVRYQYQEFADSELDAFIDYGLNKIGVDGLSTSTNYTGVGLANFNVVCLYAASQGYLSLSSRYAKFIDHSAEGKSFGKSKISERYLTLSQEYEMRAEKERLSAQGQRQERSTVAHHKTTSFAPRSAYWQPPR
jgi:hypothetical protein